MSLPHHRRPIKTNRRQVAEDMALAFIIGLIAGAALGFCI